MLELKHIFDFSQVTLIKPIHCKTSWKLLESAVISKTNHIKQRPGFYQLSPHLENIILYENKIKTDMFVYMKVILDNDILYTMHIIMLNALWSLLAMNIPEKQKHIERCSFFFYPNVSLVMEAKFSYRWCEERDGSIVHPTKVCSLSVSKNSLLKILLFKWIPILFSFCWLLSIGHARNLHDMHLFQQECLLCANMRLSLPLPLDPLNHSKQSYQPYGTYTCQSE